MPKRKRNLLRLNPFKDRTPVQRRNAANYLLITLLSFAVSVGGTRLFLELTGYPRLGSGELHIAHVLWGGIFLFAAALLPLIFVNEWVFPLSALIGGFGIGLFIDEVGKFITESNDYFYPSAAPIVYVFFLITFVLFSLIRKRQEKSDREEMYEIFERFNEILDHDLSAVEYKELVQSLEEVVQKKESTPLAELAQHLKEYLDANRTRVVPEDPTIFEKLHMWAMKLERKWLDKKKLRWIITCGLLVWGGWAFISPIGYMLLTRDAAQLQIFVDQLITNRLVRNASGMNWFEARVMLEGSMGAIALIAGFMLMFKSEKVAIWIGLADLLISLTVVNLLIFYFDQFSTMVLAIYQFFLFVLLIRYKSRFWLIVPQKESKMKNEGA